MQRQRSHHHHNRQHQSHHYQPTQDETDEADARLLMLKHRLSLIRNDDDHDQQEHKSSENTSDHDSAKNNNNDNTITTLDWSNLNGVTKDKHIAFLVEHIRNGNLRSLKCLYLPYHTILHSQCDELIETFQEYQAASWNNNNSRQPDA